MSAVCILTPVVIGSWPVIQAAVAGAMVAMGFSMAGTTEDIESTPGTTSVEEEISNSEVLEEQMAAGERIVAEKDGVRVEFGRDHRGTCTICMSGEGYSKEELREMGRQISAKVVQQYAYNKVITELKERDYTVADEQVAVDGTIKLHVRRS